MAALLISEAKSEARQNNEQLYLVILGALMAFDVVHHAILQDRLAELGIPNDIWLIIKDLYSDISFRVKWLGDCSEPWSQAGGILTTHLYKVYVDPLPVETGLSSWNRIHVLRKPNSCRRCR